MFTTKTHRLIRSLFWLGTAAIAATAGRPLAVAATPMSQAIGSASLTQTFDGSPLTQTRAQKIAQDAGFDLVSFFPCAHFSDACAMFEVQDKKKVFIYQVSSDRCPLVAWYSPASLDRAGVSASATASASSSSRTAARTAAPTSGGGSAASASTTTAIGTPAIETPGDATNCFGGYVAGYRVREDSSLYADYRGVQVTLRHHYQIIDKDQRWAEAFTTVTSAWDLSKSDGTGLSDEGWAYELDAGSSVVGSDTYSTGYIASSGAIGPSLKDRCQARQDLLTKRLANAITGAEAACRLATFALPDSIKVNASFEPLGIGGSVDATKNLDFCGQATKIANAMKDEAGAENFNDCMENPGRYFPADYPPPAVDFEIKLAKGFAVAYATDSTGTANCPATYTATETADMGGGETCTAQVQRSCAPSGTSGCYCSDPKVVSDIVCTDTSP